MKRITALFLGALLCVLSLCGCGSSAGKAADEVRVVASIYPVYVALLNLTQGVPGVSVDLMSETNTGCLHNYTLLPGDMEKLEKCDLFVINGAGMEGFLEQVMENRPALPVADSSQGIAFLLSRGYGQEEVGEDGDCVINAHVWTSVACHIRQVENIYHGLYEVDPKNEAAYLANRDAYIQKLQALDREMADSLFAMESRRVVVFHEGFAYFADRFDFTVEAVVEEEPDAMPSPKRIASLVDLIRSHDVGALLVEPHHMSRSARVIADEIGCALVEFNAVTTGEMGDADAYLNGMRKNAAALVAALPEE